MTQPQKRQVRPERAQGLEPEYTAQPHPILDELALEDSAEPDLSVDADELGARFLRDATEQGDFDPERTWPDEEPPQPPAADFDVAMRETDPDPIDVQDNSVQTLDNTVREFSLFDARNDSEHAYAPRERRMPEQHERRTRGAAPRSRRARFLLTAADFLRSIASRLQQRIS